MTWLRADGAECGRLDVERPRHAARPQDRRDHGLSPATHDQYPPRFVDESGRRPVLWLGNNHGAAIIKVSRSTERARHRTTSRWPGSPGHSLLWQPINLPPPRTRLCTIGHSGCAEGASPDAMATHSSYAGLTRASIRFVSSLAKTMDCRVKPGNDEGRDSRTPGLHVTLADPSLDSSSPEPRLVKPGNDDRSNRTAGSHGSGSRFAPSRQMTSSPLRDELAHRVGFQAFDAAFVAVADSLTPPKGVSGVEMAMLC